MNTNNAKSNANYVRCVRGYLVFKQKTFKLVFAGKLQIKLEKCFEQKMPETQHLPIYLKFYQLVKFLSETVRNFPKHHKYAIGRDLLRLAWNCLDMVLEANALPNEKKHQKIKELSVEFDKLKTRIRIAQEINLISAGQFAHIQTYYAKEAGEMVGGWLNWSKGLI